MLTPTYYLWHPRLDFSSNTKGNLLLSVTSLSAPNIPIGSIDFCQQILEDLGVDGIVTSWEVIPYRSKYHGEIEADNWKDIWKLNSRLVIRGEFKGNPQTFDQEYYETEAFSPNPDSYVRLVFANIISDFESQQQRVIAKCEVENLLDGTVDIRTYDVEEIDICSQFFQLQIMIGPFDESAFLDREHLLEDILEICRRSGGITHFDTRAEHWGEC